MTDSQPKGAHNPAMHSSSRHTLLSINSGSSSLKFALFAVAENRPLQGIYRGQLSAIGHEGRFRINDADGKPLYRQKLSISDHPHALQILLDWLDEHTDLSRLMGVGHRVVHGGSRYHQPVMIDADVMDYLHSIIPLAPNHQPASLLGISSLQKRQPELPQIACFDTAFHHTRPAVEQRFALPDHPGLKDVRRYGFHGLSYEYIARALPDYLGPAAEQKIIVAHLGHGASLCALHHRRSQATSMTFTPLDGIPMGTRCGSLDPAVVLYLLQQGMNETEISDLLYFQSGLLGLSELSDNLAELLKSSSPKAQFAIELFIQRIVREIGAMAATLGGVDALIFTAGIGENSADIRAAIGKACSWLGLQLDEKANRAARPCITDNNSPVSAWLIPTDEEYMIAEHSLALIDPDNKHRMSL